MTTNVFLGAFSVVDAGKEIDFVDGKVLDSDEVTNKKNTRMVKISISETIFNDAARSLRRLW